MSIKYFYKNTAEFNKIDQWVNTGDWGALLFNQIVRENWTHVPALNPEVFFINTCATKSFIGVIIYSHAFLHRFITQIIKD